MGAEDFPTSGHCPGEKMCVERLGGVVCRESGVVEPGVVPMVGEEEGSFGSSGNLIVGCELSNGWQLPSGPVGRRRSRERIVL